MATRVPVYPVAASYDGDGYASATPTGFREIQATDTIPVANIPSAIPATKIANGSVSDVEFETLNGITTGLSIQTQIANAKVNPIIIAVSDETTDLTTGTAKVTFRMPFAMTLTDVRASVNTAPTGSTIIVDINEGGSTILSTKISIDASEKTSTTAVTPPVISDTTLADDAEITIDIDQIGSTVPGKGLKVTLIGYKT